MNAEALPQQKAATAREKLIVTLDFWRHFSRKIA